jgi:4-amino-4-deoxy-L-arabinose transferase-like glycosyltransferase
MSSADHLFVSQKKRYSLLQPPWPLFALIVAGLLRLPVLFVPGVIHNDSYEYIRAAKSMLHGDWVGGVAPPVYSFCIMVLNSITGDYELAGVLVSWIFGVLVVVPVYFLAKKVFNERIGIFASLLAAVQPTLYFYSGSALSDSMYYFFLALSVYLGWLAFEKGNLVSVALFSLSTTISYLIRPEAIGFIFIFSVWVLCVNPPHEKRSFFRKLTLSVLAVVCFIVFSLPYLVALRKEFGRWEISRKASISLKANEESTDLKTGLDKNEETGSLNLDKRKKISLSSFLTEPAATLKKITTGFIEVILKYQQALTPMLFVFAILGFARRRQDRSLWKVDLYLLSYVLFFFVMVLPFFWVTKRHTSHLVLIALPWSAIGIMRIADFIRRRTTFGFLRDRAHIILLVVVMAILFTEGFVERINSRKHRMIRKEVGIWMKDNVPKGPVISRLPHEAFYADMEWINVQGYDVKDLLRKATEKNAKYLVVDEKVIDSKVNFINSLEENNVHLIYVNQKRNQKLFVFSFHQR